MNESMLATRQSRFFMLFLFENQLIENLKVAINHMSSIANPIGFVSAANRGLESSSLVESSIERQTYRPEAKKVSYKPYQLS